MAATQTSSTGHAIASPPDPCKIVPPTDTQLAIFGEEDQFLLRRLCEFPSEFVEFVDHELFAKPNAEKTLFGEKASFQGDTQELDHTEESFAAVAREGGSLTTAQEILLFQRLNYARMRVGQLCRGHAGDRLCTKTLRQLAGWARRVSRCRELLTQINLPLVLAMAKRTRLGGLDFNELVSEGNFALLRSVDKFDCSRGFKFSTYACRAILKSFSRVAMKTSRYRLRFPAEFDPTLEKSDFVDRKRDDVEAECVDDIRDILARNRAELNDMEQTVIRERFALDTDDRSAKPKTLEQVGQMIGVTKERVRQIQNKALKKIRTILEEKYLAA